jgi:hypothetical protein
MALWDSWRTLSILNCLAIGARIALIKLPDKNEKE